jgi:chloramphenicol-sensitive protein RarD
MPPISDNRPTTGLALGFSAYLLWGFFPVFFKALVDVTPLEILAHRIIWSTLFLVLLISGRKQWRVLSAILKNRKDCLRLLVTAILISTNWLVFIIAIESGYVLQASLGYFITPLVNVLLGRLLLSERLRSWQKVSVCLVVIGVLCQIFVVGPFPWIALILASTFGLYGLMRKTASFDSLTGLTGETLVITPIALAYLIWLALSDNMVFWHGALKFDLLLPASGIVTAIPLLLFAAATRRLRLSTIGFLQYITPTLHFLLAVLLYKESFTAAHMLSFALIWTALIIYSIDATRAIGTTRPSKNQQPNHAT